VIDDWGRTPRPFATADGTTIYPPAYQQVLKGLPAVNYSARDIVYRPRNVRAHRVYGYSPVQQVLMTVNIALRRQLWQLDYFTEGSIPDALIGVPQGWTPDQIKQFQDYWDTEFAGDLAKRRRAKFVPGETAAKVVQTKEPQHKDDFDEWLARIICFAFSVPPQWATKAMNRATAENQSAQAEEEGLEPTKEWVKDLIDEIVAEEFSSPDLELHWLDEDEGDPETVLEGRLKVGALTLNEMRDALGLDPFDNAAADRPMVLTATGFVPIEANAQGQEAAAEGRGANGSDANGQTQSAKLVLLKASADDPEHPGWPAGTPGGRGGKFRPKDSEGGEAAGNSASVEDERVRYQKYGEGHHWVGWDVYKNFNLKPETRKVFEDATSGALADPSVNFFNREHRIYDRAVEKALRDYLAEHKMTDDQMEPQQAEEFYRKIRGSNDPIIGGLNRKIIRQRLRYIQYFYLGRGRGEVE
jgi:hypothetical protein